MEKLIVDRIEEGFAILEKPDKSHITVSLETIGFPLKEGSVLIFDGKTYTADKESEHQRRSRIFALQEKLKNKTKN